MKSALSAVFAAVLASGAVHAASIAKPQTVTLDRTAVVAGSVLPAGTYRIDLAAGLESVRFVQGKHTVAEAPCKVGWAEVVYPGNAVHYRTVAGDPDRLVKIVFASSKLAVEFPAQPTGASDTPIANAADRP